MTAQSWLRCANGSAVATASVPVVPFAALQDGIAVGVERGHRLTALFAEGRQRDVGCRVWGVLADDEGGTLSVGAADLSGPTFPSLTPRCPQAHLFERVIHEQTGLVPTDHPGLEPVRSWATDRGRPIGVPDPRAVSGEGVHEVAVGPVHAGVIEPGHFRFQCDGEHVFRLDIALGYQHRGIEAALAGGPDRRALHLIETAAGDSSVAHALACCHALEALMARPVGAHALAVRAIALELERLANHTGDLGALANDVGFLPTASYCGRLRGDFLNLTAALCGNRFGRGLVRPGGCRFGIEPALAVELRQRLAVAGRETAQAVQLLWTTPSVMARFEGTGPVSAEVAVALGMVGPAARACGVPIDARTDHPLGMYRFLHVPEATAKTGDVLGRAFVRWVEIQRSLQFLDELLTALPAPTATTLPARLAPDHLAVSLVEGWRGEVCHVVRTDAAGRFACYRIVDPSFRNWHGLAMAMRDQQISDFPLCNKSFNLSYCGHDL